jgi:hypothetical protein
MAVAIALSSVTPELVETINKICLIKPAKSQYDSDPSAVECFAVNELDDSVYLPLGAWRHFLEEFPEYEYPRANISSKKVLYTIETDPKGYRDQDEVCRLALKRLKSERAVFIAANCGFGKTTLGNYIACHLKLKTAVICHLDKVNEQWVEEFTEFSNAKVQRVKGKVLDPNADVYVIGVRKAASLPREMLGDIGLVIFDEAHISTITAFSKSLLRFQPRYVIGLSATPKRADGMQKLLSMYFGPASEFIVRNEVKDFTVYKVETPYQPDVRYNIVNGVTTLDWTHVINTLAYNEERQDLIVSLVKKHPEHYPLILTARTLEWQSLKRKLVKAGERSIKVLAPTTGRKKNAKENLNKLKVAELRQRLTELKLDSTGRKKELVARLEKTSKKSASTEKVAKITLANWQKGGVGYNDPTRTMLILTFDSKSVEQFEGRIRTDNNIIYVLVDNFKTCETHWREKERWFIKRGAVIETIDLRGEGSVTTPIKTTLPSRRYLRPS